MAELKPCPFCGGEARFEAEQICYGHGEYLKNHFVRCKICGAKSPSETEYYLNSNDCKVIVRDKWNTRTPQKLNHDSLCETETYKAGGTE